MSNVQIPNDQWLIANAHFVILALSFFRHFLQPAHHCTTELNMASIARILLAGCGWLLLTIPLLAESSEQPALRRPIAIQALADGKRVLTANRSGTLSLVEIESRRVVREFPLGKQLSDLVPLPNPTNSERFLATDEQQHQLLEIELVGDQVERRAAIKVPAYPVSVRTSATGEWASVASLWSRRLTLFQRTASAKWNERRIVDLSFAPRAHVFLPGDKQLVLFDAFTGRLAVVEIETGRMVLERTFPGHSVRGLALDHNGTMLLAAHQMLNPFAHAGKSDMHWGLLMSNDLRWMSIDSLLNPARELYSGGQVHPLGIPDHGGGDPAGLAMNNEGMVVVCLGGVNEVMLGKRADDSLRAIRVGKRPTAVAFSRDQQTAFVANTFGDSISIVDPYAGSVIAEIPLAAARERTEWEHGEELFYDARFSHEGWMSCHSCHVDGHSNFTRNDNLSDGGFGAPKLVISLLGRKDTAPFAWNASVKNLPEQVRNSLEKTMQTDYSELAEKDINALAAYIESLPVPPNVEALRGTIDAAALARGRVLFEKNDCAQCHPAPNFTVTRVEDVQLPDETGKRLFNPPSLRGISQRDTFLHDGRALSLPAVFLKHQHPANHHWDAADVVDLAAFLRSL